MFNIISQKLNENQNDIEIPSHQETNASKDMEEKGTFIHSWWECEFM
jgi:hypothetical protein